MSLRVFFSQFNDNHVDNCTEQNVAQDDAKYSQKGNAFTNENLQWTYLRINYKIIELYIIKVFKALNSIGRRAFNKIASTLCRD